MLFILEQHVSQVLSEDYRARKEERGVGTMGRRRRERETDRQNKNGGRWSFERLLTSKLTVIVVLARGESTFKHTG